MHDQSSRLWEKRVWEFPLIHNYEFGFGLSADSSTQASTIMPYIFQDNALIDYELLKTNPDNADFAISAHGRVHKGSHISRLNVKWMMYLHPTDTEISLLKVNTMEIHTAFLNRLDAFDTKTGEDIETILELTHEVTDTQCYPLFNTTKLFESGGTFDFEANQPGLTGTQQPEGVAFDKEKFFDAMHYYTNRQMLKSMTSGMRTLTLSEPIVPHGRPIVTGGQNHLNSMCKTANDYMFSGELFHVPQTGSISQYHLATETTAIEHVTIKGFVRFNEHNPDFNFARS